MSGQESVLHQAIPDGATTEHKILGSLALNGTTNANSTILNNGTTTQLEVVAEEATHNGVADEIQISSPVPPQGLPRDPSEGPDYSIEWLDLSRMVIAAKNAKIYAMALDKNLLPNLKVLFLEGNAGDIGIRATLSALRAGHVKGLKKLILWEVSSYDKITPYEAGTDMIAAAFKRGNLPNLNTMDLTGSLPKLVPARRKSETITDLLRFSWGTGRLLEGRNICIGCLIPFCITDPEKNQALECLRCLDRKLEKYSGDDGITKIAKALRETPIVGLRILILQQNYIGDTGASRLAEILKQNSLPNLDELDLRHNPVGFEGAKKIVYAFLENPLLTVRVKLDWPNFMQRWKYVAFRDSNIKLEFRLKELGICAKDIVIGEYAELEYYWSSEREYRLHLQCQAECASYVNEQNFKAHNVIGGRGIKVTSSKIKGDKSQKILHIDVDTTALDLESRVIDKFYIRSSTRFFLPGPKISRNARAVCRQVAKFPKLKGHPVEELLVLAESNPDEFYAMFGLRQVLLRNPTGRNEGLYSRVWVCTSCFDDYEKRLTAVKPITTDDMLQPRLSSPRSPEPKSEGAPHRLQCVPFLNSMRGFCSGASRTT